MSRTLKTVAVIGAGPSGLAAVKELKAAGLEVTAFDGSANIGRFCCGRKMRLLLSGKNSP
jgi:NADPH-dependent glutamate synthase beta subunit-like oxidoreductase